MRARSFAALLVCIVLQASSTDVAPDSGRTPVMTALTHAWKTEQMTTYCPTPAQLSERRRIQVAKAIEGDNAQEVHTQARHIQKRNHTNDHTHAQHHARHARTNEQTDAHLMSACDRLRHQLNETVTRARRDMSTASEDAEGRGGGSSGTGSGTGSGIGSGTGISIGTGTGTGIGIGTGTNIGTGTGTGAHGSERSTEAGGSNRPDPFSHPSRAGGPGAAGGGRA